MTLIEIFAIFIIHYIADFILQDEKWALGKSKNWNDLLSHTLTYSGIWFGVAVLINLITIGGFLGREILFSPEYIMLFTIITFICHTITDYFTSRIVSKMFAENRYGSSIPNWGAFSMIGLDQVFHYIQLFGTYYLLKVYI